jgi:hypothetical protein
MRHFTTLVAANRFACRMYKSGSVVTMYRERNPVRMSCSIYSVVLA